MDREGSQEGCRSSRCKVQAEKEEVERQKATPRGKFVGHSEHSDMALRAAFATRLSNGSTIFKQFSALGLPWLLPKPQSNELHKKS